MVPSCESENTEFSISANYFLSLGDMACSEDSTYHTEWHLTGPVAITDLLSISSSLNCELSEKKTELYLLFHL